MPRLLAVSKHQPAEAILALYQQGQLRFGENYVQEAATKQQALASYPIEWHLIGHLQSNKAKEAANLFDWIQTIDRAKLIPLLAKERPTHAEALNLLIQVNIDDEDSKHGCDPSQINRLAEEIARYPTLRLRGLMAIPRPDPDISRRKASFANLHRLYTELRLAHPGIDTLSMGMSEDFEQAIAEGATMVRIGTALFGARPASK